MPPPTSRPDIAPPAVLSPIAYKAFAVGALRFGSISLFTHILLHRFHPTYRRLTPQFKAFIQISTMTLGGCIYAERGVSEFNEVVRRKNRAMERARRAWSEREMMLREIEMADREEDAAAMATATATAADSQVDTTTTQQDDSTPSPPPVADGKG